MMNVKIQDFNLPTVKNIKTFKEEKIMERERVIVITQKPKGGGGYLINLASLGGVVQC